MSFPDLRALLIVLALAPGLGLLLGLAVAGSTRKGSRLKCWQAVTAFFVAFCIAPSCFLFASTWSGDLRVTEVCCGGATLLMVLVIMRSWSRL